MKAEKSCGANCAYQTVDIRWVQLIDAASAHSRATCNGRPPCATRRVEDAEYPLRTFELEQKPASSEMEMKMEMEMEMQGPVLSALCAVVVGALKAVA